MIGLMAGKRWERRPERIILRLWSGRESKWLDYGTIIRSVKIRSRAQVIRYLNRMVELGILEKKREGRKTYYRPTRPEDVLKAHIMMALDEVRGLPIIRGTVSLWGIDPSKLTDEEREKLKIILDKVSEALSELDEFVSELNARRERELDKALLECLAKHYERLNPIVRFIDQYCRFFDLRPVYAELDGKSEAEIKVFIEEAAERALMLLAEALLETGLPREELELIWEQIQRDAHDPNEWVKVQEMEKDMKRILDAYDRFSYILTQDNFPPGHELAFLSSIYLAIRAKEVLDEEIRVSPELEKIMSRGWPELLRAFKEFKEHPDKNPLREIRDETRMKLLEENMEKARKAAQEVIKTYLGQIRRKSSFRDLLMQ